MVNKGNNIILIILFLLTTSMVEAAVSISIDRNPIRVNETFELTLHMESAPVSRPPLEGLPAAISIIRSSNFYQRSSINGKTEIQAGWRFTLKATEEGIFTIPAFNIDGNMTKPIQLKVLAAVNSTSINGQQDAIQLKATVDFNEVYVQQQIIFTIHLYRAVQAQYASLTEPKMPEALLERLGEDRQFETNIDGHQYIVLERRYVIFPQQQGTQVISPVIFTAEVSEGTRRFSSLGRFQSKSKTVSLSSKSIKINVKPQPKILDNWWLPATKITLTEKWLPEPPEFRVGKPITWIYTIEALGLTATQIPEILPLDVEGFKFYPDTANSENAATQEGVVGTRIQKIAVVPTRAGALTLPELKISWWDVTQDKEREITLPEKTIEVLPSLDGNFGQQPQNQKKLDTTVDTATASRTSEHGINSKEPAKSELISWNDNGWKMIALTSLLLWFITIIYMTLRKSTSSSQTDDKQTPQNEENIHFNLSNIQAACKNNSATKTRKAILGWCAGQKHFEHVRTLSDLARCVQNPDLSEQLKLLERQLYAANQKPWNGAVLLPLLKQLNHHTNDVQSVPKEQLPPLHPE
ncbi:MAG: protein BatD [Gammaproteobacteria bacterium]|nr:protein BatD [Gammaproteobacteria bacterium]